MITIRDLGRGNALGILRLLFASLVIISHTAEIRDGSREREVLTRIFGTLSFGELAVDAFFVISGYLIVASFMASSSALDYMKKRVLRIMPGFFVASFVSLLIIAPLVGASLHEVLGHLPRYVVTIAVLHHIDVPGTFPGLGYNLVNGSLWTIAYEFRCYLLVVVLGVTGCFRFPKAIALTAIVMMALYLFGPTETIKAGADRLPLNNVWLGMPTATLRLTAIFLIGSCFYLWRDRIVVSPRGALFAALALIGCMCVPKLAEIGVAVFGGYLIFAFAYWGKGSVLERINNRTDISYGTYLYGWPIGAAILWFLPGLPLSVATGLAVIASMAMGWLSWHVVEKPAIRAFQPQRDRSDQAVAVVSPSIGQGYSPQLHP